MATKNAYGQTRYSLDKPISVTVTPGDSIRSIQGSAFSCIVATAVKRKYPGVRVSVIPSLRPDCGTIWIGRTKYSLPPAANKLAVRFDNGEKINETLRFRLRSYYCR